MLQNFNIGGNAAKGPLQGATAFLDANNNNTLDAGETSVTTLADGSYTLSSNSATARVVVISNDETIDTSSGAAVTNLVMSAPLVQLLFLTTYGRVAGSECCRIADPGN